VGTESLRNRTDCNYAIAIGIGLALFPVHNRWLVDAALVGGEATLFLPVFGALLFLLAVPFYLRDNWSAMDWGDRKIYIPLLVIVGAIGLSGITADTLEYKFAPILMGGVLFSLYLVARKLGKDIFIPLAIGAGIASMGVIISGVLYPGEVTGGLVFENNYDIVVGYVLLGTALFIKRYQWALVGLALVAMYLAGSPEGVFATGVFLAMVWFRKDWGKRLFITLAPVCLVATLWFGLGYGQELYGYTAKVAQGTPTIPSESLIKPPSSGESPVVDKETQEADMSVIGYRLAVIKRAMANIEPLGNGYNLTGFSKQLNVHNLPLVIVQQLGWGGILASIAWLWVSGWCLVRTRWKYVWGLVLALSVFDHFVWTQLAPWWWAIIGVSTAGSIKTDLMFKGGNPAVARVKYMARRFNNGV